MMFFLTVGTVVWCQSVPYPSKVVHLRQRISIHMKLSSGYSHSRIVTSFRFHIIMQLREWMTLNAEIRIPGKTIFCRRILRVHPSSTAVVISIIEAYVNMVQCEGFPSHCIRPLYKYYIYRLCTIRTKIL